MSSIFSLSRRREEPTGAELLSESASTEISSFVAPQASTTEEIAAELASEEIDNNAFTPERALENMLDALRTVLNWSLPPDDEPASPPNPNVSVISLSEHAMAIGGRRGIEHRGSFPVVELKGGRLDAMVRFQVWAQDVNDLEAKIGKLHGDLLAAKDALWRVGFLRIAAKEASSAEHVSSLEAWRKTADYGILYEFHYGDTDGATSLIVRIPIHSDLEERDSPQQETTVVTDEMVRWDEESSLPLVVRGPLSLERLVILDYLPTPLPTRGVTITRTFDRATGSPTAYPTLDDFLSAVSDLNPDRHARWTCATLSDFLEAFTDTGGTIPLGDWDKDEVTDQYRPRALAKEFTNLAIDAVDNTKISSADRPFDSNNVGKRISILVSAGFAAGGYRIMAVDASHIATLDRSCGDASSTGGTGKIERVHILELPTVADRLEITLHGDALDRTGVMYLRAVRT